MSVVLRVWLSFFLIYPQQYAFAATPSLANLRMAALIAPYDPSAIEPYLKALQANRASLEKTPDGRASLAEGAKMRMLSAMKQKLDKCFGGDIFSVGAARNMFRDAMSGTADIKCTMRASALGDAEEFSKELDGFLQGPPLDKSKALSDLNHQTFNDTAEKAARADARLSNLLTNPPDTRSFTDAICGSGDGCPAALKAQMNRAIDQEKAALKQKGYEAQTPEKAALRLQGIRAAMNMQLYRQDLPYHISQNRTDPQAAQRWSQITKAMNQNDKPIPYDSIALKQGEALAVGQFPSGVEPGNAASLAKFEQQVLANVPNDFYRSQEAMEADPLAQLLSRGDPGWREALGYGNEPHVRPLLGNRYTVVLTQRADGATSRPITAAEIQKTRDTQLRQLRETMKDLRESTYAANPTDDAKEDTFRKLIISNPAGAAKGLLTDPRRVTLYCDAFKALARKEMIEKYVNFGLTAAIIGGAIFTGGATLMGAGTLAAVGTVGVAGTMVVETANSLWQASDLTEVANLQRTACLSQTSNGSSCKDYEHALQAAQSQYVAAGLSVAGQAAFMKSFAGLARGSVSALAANTERLPAAAEMLSSISGKALAGKLGDDAAAEFLAQMSTGTKEQIAQAKKLAEKMTPEQLNAWAAEIRTTMQGGGHACTL